MRLPPRKTRLGGGKDRCPPAGTGPIGPAPSDTVPDPPARRNDRPGTDVTAPVGFPDRLSESVPVGTKLIDDPNGVGIGRAGK